MDLSSNRSVNADQPWPGLEPFSEAARDFFHGREQEVADLTRRVKGQTLTVLFGQSGLGKTSLLRAGLFPQLRRDCFLPIYIRLHFTAGEAALIKQVRDQIAEAIAEAPVQKALALEKADS